MGVNKIKMEVVLLDALFRDDAKRHGGTRLHRGVVV
jgi:hypothetical protein